LEEKFCSQNVLLRVNRTRAPFRRQSRNKRVEGFLVGAFVPGVQMHDKIEFLFGLERAMFTQEGRFLLTLVPLVALQRPLTPILPPTLWANVKDICNKADNHQKLQRRRTRRKEGFSEENCVRRLDIVFNMQVSLKMWFLYHF
jgi:hypothetical protein